jgi:hypothetical protein
VVHTCTLIDPATPTSPPARPKEAAIEVTSSSECALTVMSPPASMSVPEPSHAVVLRSITPTSIPMPTPLPPVLAARPPAALNVCRVSVAETVTSPPAVTVVLSSMKACVSIR